MTQCHLFVSPPHKQLQEQNDNMHDVLDAVSSQLPFVGPDWRHPHSPPVPPIRRNSMDSIPSYESESETPVKRISYQSRKTYFSNDVPPRYPIRTPSDSNSDEKTVVSDVTLEVTDDEDYSIVLTPSSTKISRLLSKQSQISNQDCSDHITLSNITERSDKNVAVVTLSSPSFNGCRPSIHQNQTRKLIQRIPKTNSNKIPVVIGMTIVIISPIFYNIPSSRAA